MSMSMSIYGLYPNQEIKEIEYFKSGTGATALKLWLHLEEKYLPIYERNGIKSTRLAYFNPGKSPCNEIWDLVEDERLAPEERILMGLTFDYVFVKREDIPFICKILSSDFANEGMHRLVSHLEQALQNNPEVEAFAIMWQTVNDYYGCGYDENDEEIYPIWNPDKNWFLFDDEILKKCKETIEDDNYS